MKVHTHTHTHTPAQTYIYVHTQTHNMHSLVRGDTQWVTIHTSGENGYKLNTLNQKNYKYWVTCNVCMVIFIVYKEESCCQWPHSPLLEEGGRELHEVELMEHYERLSWLQVVELQR